jgi:hypothetical protein
MLCHNTMLLFSHWKRGAEHHMSLTESFTQLVDDAVLGQARNWPVLWGYAECVHGEQRCCEG